MLLTIKSLFLKSYKAEGLLSWAYLMYQLLNSFYYLHNKGVNGYNTAWTAAPPRVSGHVCRTACVRVHGVAFDPLSGGGSHTRAECRPVDVDERRAPGSPAFTARRILLPSGRGGPAPCRGCQEIEA